MEATQSLLEEIAVVLEKYESLGKESSTIGAKAEKALKKIRWDQDAIRGFRSRVISKTTLLDAYNSSLTREVSRRAAENVATLHERMRSLQLDQDQRERHALFDWLTTLICRVSSSVLL